MKKYLKLFIAGLLIMGLMVAVAGCGGDNAADTSNDTGNNTGDNAAENQEADNSGSNEEKVYVVGTEPTFPPFEMTDDNNEITGFDIDLIKAIAEAEGFQVEIKKLGFDGLVLALQSGNIDIAASGMSITPERQENVDFSEPYIDASLRIAVTAENEEIKSKDDLKGKVAAVQIGTTGASTAEELKAEGILKDVKTFKTVDVVFMELLNGGADCVINDAPVTEAYMVKNEGQIKMVGDPLVADQYGLAVAKGNTELLEKINSGLKKVKESGKYDELIKKYF